MDENKNQGSNNSMLDNKQGNSQESESHKGEIKHKREVTIEERKTQ